MKPLNLDNRPCSPVSSNCVVWQGPDIACINLCKGDTVSDVVAAMATELCTILDQLNVSNYDLSCLGITACGPKDFQALIQLLIDKICEAEGIVEPDVRVSSGCPDCVVTVAPCFRTGNQTTMQLLDYVQMIAQKVCTLIDQITDINQQLDEIIIRIENLENAPLPVTPIPSFTLGCQIGSLTGSQFINVTLQEFINNVWCDFQDATGSTADLISAVSAICIADTDLQLSTGTPFSTNPNWIQSGSYDTVADAINNLWVALCDVYNAFGNISLAVQDTNSIDLTYSGGTLSANIVDTGWVDLLGFDWYSGGIADPTSPDFNKPQCRRIGNVIHFRGTVMIPLADPDKGGIPLAWSFGSAPNVDSYYTNTTVTPSTGTGGVTLNTSGSLAFNNGQRVIPPSVLAAGTNVDGSYSMGPFSVGVRTVPTKLNTSTALTALFKPIVTTNGTLVFLFPKDIEQGRLASNPLESFFTSPLNNIISNVVSGEFVPKYDQPSRLDSSSISGLQSREVTYDGTLTYPFTCNAGSEQQVGGFQTRIDGLQAFVAPCNTDIKPYVCN